MDIKTDFNGVTLTDKQFWWIMDYLEGGVSGGAISDVISQMDKTPGVSRLIGYNDIDQLALHYVEEAISYMRVTLVSPTRTEEADAATAAAITSGTLKPIEKAIVKNALDRWQCYVKSGRLAQDMEGLPSPAMATDWEGVRPHTPLSHPYELGGYDKHEALAAWRGELRRRGWLEAPELYEYVTKTIDLFTPWIDYKGQLVDLEATVEKWLKEEHGQAATADDYDSKRYARTTVYMMPPRFVDYLHATILAAIPAKICRLLQDIDWTTQKNQAVHMVSAARRADMLKTIIDRLASIGTEQANHALAIIEKVNENA